MGERAGKSLVLSGMKISRSKWRAPLFVTALAWCAAAAAPDDETDDPPPPIDLQAAEQAADTQADTGGSFEPRVMATFGSSDIQGWHAPDNRTLVIRTYTHGNFKAMLLGPCTGIRFAETLGFSTPGPYELDSSTSLVLPDGSHCAFRTLERYTEEDEKRDQEQQ